LEHQKHRKENEKREREKDKETKNLGKSEQTKDKRKDAQSAQFWFRMLIVEVEFVEFESLECNSGK